MFCMRCGQEVPAAAEFCPACGQSTKSPEAPPAQTTSYGTVPPPPPPQAQQPGYPAAWAAQPNLKGVGGFLLFFCICLIVLWPLWTFAQYGALYLTRHVRFVPASLFGIVRTLFGVVVGISLWMQSRSALMLLRIYFVISVLLLAWTIFGLVTFYMRYNVGLRAYSMLPWLTSVMPYTVFLILGIAYFVQSKRVRATYGENLL